MKNLIRYKVRSIIVKQSLSVLFFVAMSASEVFSQGAVSDETEKQALLAFYNATNNSPSKVWSIKWNTDKLADGVTPLADFTTTYGPNGEVPDLAFVTIENNDVVSIIIPSGNNIEGQIPNSIINLTQLKNFTIYSNNYSSPNNINGIMPNLSALVNLETLIISQNTCSGTVDWLGTNGAASNKLKLVDLSNYYASVNHITIFPGSGFSNLINLQNFNLNYTRFTTSASSVNNLLGTQFDYLDNLLTLSIDGCNLSAGSFPSQFGGMAKLKTLNAGTNPIVNVPAVFGNLSTLTFLELNNIGIQSLDANFASLDNLSTLWLSYNQITNNQSFYNIVEVLKGCAALSNLTLSHNNISEVPTNFSGLDPLRVLDLSFNPIAGSDLNNLVGSKITNLSLVNCYLTTKLPNSLPSLVSLTTLELGNAGQQYINDPSHNLIDMNSPGVESVLKNLQYLKTLSIVWSAIVGPAPLPDWFGTSDMASIENLYLNNNTITLPLPDNFKLFDNLKVLYLNNNSLSGAMTALFNCTDLPKLEFVSLASNQLTNPFPDFSQCSQLRWLDLSNNQFVGTIPDYLMDITSFYYLNVMSNGFDEIPNFGSKSNHSSFYVYLNSNKFDFSDLQPFFNANSCSPLVGSISYANQNPGIVGDPLNFYVPEGMQVAISFDTPDAEDSKNFYKWQHYEGGSWIDKSSWPEDPETGNPFIINNASPSNIGTYRTMIQNRCVTGLTLTGNNVNVIFIPPLCQSAIPSNVTGGFKMDKLTGTIVFDRNDCASSIPITCVFGPPQGIDNIVSASATVHSDSWSYSYRDNYTAVENPFNSGERGKWRPKSSYSFNSIVNQSNDKNYNAGTYKFKTFNWQSGEKSNNPGWLLINSVSKYSPNGDPVEEYNALKIASAAKFGYNNAVPYLIAQNSDYRSVLFESFENVYAGNLLEDDFVLSNATVVTGAHAGKSSLQINGITQFKIRNFITTDQIKKKGLQAKVWIKQNNGAQFIAPNLALIKGSTQILVKDFEFISRTGDWSLYQLILTPLNFTALQVDDVFELKFGNNQSGTIWIDDLRIQPVDTEMTAYVYDKTTLRLLTVFDDQHFGLYYQYNGEGKLVRKIVETERGIKTIQETQYNTPTR